MKSHSRELGNGLKFACGPYATSADVRFLPLLESERTSVGLPLNEYTA
jgi:hypothetical protein